MEEIREQIKEVVAYLLDCERTTDKETIESYTDTIMLGADKYAEAKINNFALGDVSGMLCGSFESDSSTSSATKCKCGREKWEHPKPRNYR